MKLEKGITIAERFELIKKLGNTSFGEVWLSEDKRSESIVTVKMISSKFFNKRTDIRKLKNEFKSFSQIKCRHISEVYEMFDEKGLLFYTSEYVEGSKLTEFRGEGLSVLVPMFIDISKALLELHNYGIVHGDIKPGDIIVKSDRSIKLVDTGLLSYYEQRHPEVRKSFTYIAPEIINRKPYDWRADLYSLGVIMYEILYTKLPWNTPPFVENGDTLSIDITFPENSSPHINSIIKTLLAVEPENRFVDASELIRSLEHILAGTDTGSDSTGKSQESIKIGESDFLSRRVETSSLMEMLDSFEATGIDNSVIVESPSGAGRTRFLKEFEKRISLRKMNVLFFSASQSQNLASDIVDTIWESLDREYRLQLALKWRGTVFLYFPHFKSYGEFKNSPEAKHLHLANEDFYRLASLFRDFIKMGTRNKPLVLLLDNLNSIDKRSLRLIQEISAGFDSSIRLFTVVTVDPAGGYNIDIPAFSRITLSPFTFSETRDFIENSLDQSANQIDNELFLWLYRNSKGLAKQIRSLLYLLIEEKIVYSRENHIFFNSRVLADKGVEFLLQRKMNSLSTKEQMVLKCCSIYKRFATKEALVYLTKNLMSEEEVESALSVLESNYLTVLNKNGKINIVNRQFQPVIYDAIPEHERKELHRLMGDYISLTWHGLLHMNINHFAFAAYHYNQAGEFEKALKLYLYSVGGSMAQFNSELAESSTDESLEIVERNQGILTGKKLYAVYLFAGRMYYKLGIYKKAVPLLEKSYEIWKDDTILEDLVFSLANDSDPSKATKFISGYKDNTPDKKAVKHYLRSFVYLTSENNYTKSNYHLKRAVAYIEKGHGKLFGPIRKFTLKQLQFDLDLFMNTSDFETLDKLRNELVESSKHIESKAFLIDAMNASFVFYWNYNEMKQAYNILHESLKLSLEIFDNYRITRSYLNLANCSHRLGRLNDVRFYLDKAIEYARKGSGANILKQCYCNYGELAIIKGEFSLAENYLYNAEDISKREFRDADLVLIYSLQTMLSLLKNEVGTARNIGGKMRRYLDQFKTLGQSKLVIYYSSLMLLEALTGNDKEFFFELDTKLQKLLNSYPLFKKANELLHLTCRIIFYKRNGDRNGAMNQIHDIEKKGIKSTHSLYQMLFYYHASLFLKEAAPASGLLKKYIGEGLKFSVQIQSNHFISLFNSISYLLETDETENIINRIKDALNDISSHDSNSKETVESEISKLQSHILNAKNQIEHLVTMNSNFSTIIDIVKSIAGRTDFSRITETIVKKMLDALSLEICGIVFLGSESEENNYLILDSSYNEYKMSDFRFKAGVVARMLKTARIDFISGTPAERSFEYRSVAAAPIALKGTIKSYIYIERDSSLGPFRESEIRFLETLSESIAVIFDNIELMQIATTDTLTKLYSRRHFMNILSKEVEKAGRYSFTTSMIMLDIDHFKEINDTYGHLSGDSILRTLGELLKRTVRSSDYVGRFGGEEFVILLTGTDLEGAFQTAEKIRKACEKQSVSGISFTVSLGVTSFHEDRVKNEKDFIEKCDMALYRAKNLGRNMSVKYCDLLRR